MAYRPHTSTKLTASQETARLVAMDAFLAGRMAEGELILKSERAKLSKPEAKKIAHLLAKQGRFDDATKVLLLSSWSASSAEQELAAPPTAKVGDILYTSGGYEQTNVSFYQVVAVSGSSVSIRKLGKRAVPAESTQYETAVVPIVGDFVGVAKTKRVQKSTYGGDYKLKIDDSTAWIWDGKPQRETASGYGH
jgi:hypothetical protein